jgi:hypothetical protein
VLEVLKSPLCRIGGTKTVQNLVREKTISYATQHIQIQDYAATFLYSLGGKLTLKRCPGMPHTISSDEITEAKNILSLLRAERA